MKVILSMLVLIALTACAGPLRPVGSVMVGPHGGTVSSIVSGPEGSATVTVPVK